jgi:hypothetical protein
LRNVAGVASAPFTADNHGVVWHHHLIHLGWPDDFDWPAWIAAISALVTTLILGVTAGFALNGLEDARRTRHGALVTDLAGRWDALGDTLKLYREYADAGIASLIEKLYESDEDPTEAENDDFDLLIRWPNLIEMIGALEAKNVIDPDVIYTMWGGAIINAWEAWDESVAKLRNVSGYPDTYGNFERIAGKMRDEFRAGNPG